MKRHLWMLIVLLLAFSLACNALAGKKTPVPVSGGGTTEPAGGTTEPSGGTTEPSGGTTEPSGGNLFTPPDNLEALNLKSYRLRSTYSEQYASGEKNQLVIEQANTLEPRASHIKITSSSTSEGEQTIEMIQIGTTQWMNMGGSWMQSEGEEPTEAFGSEIMDIFDFASENPEDYTYIGKETIEGIRTKHYRLKDEVARQIALEQGGLKDVTEARIDIWVADENNLPQLIIKISTTIKGVHEEKGNAEMLLEQVVYDLNAPFTIEKPAGVKTSVADDVPTYTGPMSNTFFMADLASFETPDEPQIVAAFYKTELPKQGWTLQSDESYQSSIIQTWSKDKRTLYVMINKAENGNTSVMLSISTE